MLRRLRDLVLLTVPPLALVWLILYLGFWSGHRAELMARETPEQIERRLHPPRHVDRRTMHLLGALTPGKDSHFVHFERRKAPGAVRVCALGDSHTNGDEVGKRQDYPSQLQGLFERRGFRHLQVLNFGNAWYGFAQQYLLWQRVARHFGCDFVLLLPQSFWVERDLRFNHTDGRYPGYLHARFIVENGALRLVAPIGGDGLERRAEALRAIPHWRYLRYDRFPTSIADAILPEGLRLRSPFYHDPRPAEAEARELYRRIIAAIAADGPQVVVLFSGAGAALSPDILPGRNDIGAAFLDAPDGFPYLAPAQHPSTLGQRLIAESFFRLLTDDPRAGLDVLTVRSLPGDEAAHETRPLSAYEAVWLQVDGQRLGFFVSATNTARRPAAEHMAIFRRQGIAALLQWPRGVEAVAEADWVPLAQLPRVGGRLSFEPAGFGAESVSLGTIRQPWSGVPIFRALPPDGCAQPYLPLPKSGLRQSGGRVLLDGEEILRIRHGKATASVPPLLRLRADGRYPGDSEQLRPGDTALLMLRRAGRAPRAVPWLAFGEAVRDLLRIEQPPARGIRASDDP